MEDTQIALFSFEGANTANPPASVMKNVGMHKGQTRAQMLNLFGEKVKKQPLRPTVPGRHWKPQPIYSWFYLVAAKRTGSAIPVPRKLEVLAEHEADAAAIVKETLSAAMRAICVRIGRDEFPEIPALVIGNAAEVAA